MRQSGSMVAEAESPSDVHLSMVQSRPRSAEPDVAQLLSMVQALQVGMNENQRMLQEQGRTLQTQGRVLQAILQAKHGSSSGAQAAFKESSRVDAEDVRVVGREDVRVHGDDVDVTHHHVSTISALAPQSSCAYWLSAPRSSAQSQDAWAGM